MEAFEAGVFAPETGSSVDYSLFSRIRRLAGAEPGGKAPGVAVRTFEHVSYKLPTTNYKLVLHIPYSLIFR